MPKDFKSMDRRGGATAEKSNRVLASRFDSSRVVPFDAPLAKLAGNPLNPREETDPTVQELATSMQTVGQLQTAVVVTRDVFVDAYPDTEDSVPETAQWVTVMGNRRLAASALAGRASLEVVLAQDIATVEMIEYAIIHENLHREGLPPLREAGMFQGIMEREGISARQLAKKIGKSHAYVNQRLALNRLVPEFQAMLSAGELGVTDARSLSEETEERQHELLDVWPQLSQLVPAARALFDEGSLSTDRLEELAELSHSDQRKQLAAAARGNGVSTGGDDPAEPLEKTEGGNAVSTGADDAAEPSGEAEGGNAVSTQESGHVDDAPPSKAENGQTSKSPSTSPAQVAKYVRSKLDPAGIDELIQILTSD